MPSTHDFTPTDHNEREQVSPTPPPVRSVDEALNEIDRILHQMLLLAELSASDSNVDRKHLQKVLERLKNKIDRIADRLDSAEN